MTTATKRYIQAAKEAGCPRDQVENFAAGDYGMLRWQIPFHAAAREADQMGEWIWLLCGGARGPGKSHAILAQIGLDDCQRTPGMKWLFLRQTKLAASESIEDLVGRVLYNVPHKFKTNRIDFPNGSRILIGGYQNERDIDKYIGIEYDGIAVEEATQISLDKITKIRGSLRTSRPDWRVRMYLSTNPGGIGHTWVKQNFVMPHRGSLEGQHRFIGGLSKFFPSTYRDNPFTKQDYIDYLEGIPGPLGQAWRTGDWDVFEGMAFPSWDYEKHVIEPFEIPESWPRTMGVDWGLSKPFAALWCATNPDNGRRYIYREIYQAGLTDRQQARMILQLTPENERTTNIYADPSLWAKKSYANEVTTTKDEYAGVGLYLTKGDNDRLNGKRKVDRLLANMEDGRPGLQIFRTCPNLANELGSLPFSLTKQEDVDTNAPDHAYDALKYLLTDTRIQEEPKHDNGRRYHARRKKLRKAL